MTNKFKIIGFNKNGSQTLLGSAATLDSLLVSFSKRLDGHESMGSNNILPTFTKILVATADGFIGLELLKGVKAAA